MTGDSRIAAISIGSKRTPHRSPDFLFRLGAARAFKRPPEAHIEPHAFIAANLPLVPVPGVADIVLHRAGASSGLGRLAVDVRDSGAPYWAFPWPGGLALARYLHDRPEVVAGRRVVDLGSGSGLVAIAAARAGATRVTAAETDRYAGAAIGLNAAANGVAVDLVAEDLLAGPAPDADIVLVGDLFYTKPLARRVTSYLDRCLSAGVDVLVGDLGRPDLPRARLSPLAAYPVAEVGTARARATGQVFRFMAGSLADAAAGP